MLFCAMQGDRQAVSAVLRLSQGPNSTMQLLREGETPPEGSTFVYTDHGARFKHNLRRLNQNDGRDSFLGFRIPECACGIAIEIIAVRPEPKSHDGFKNALEHMFEAITRRPFDPRQRQIADSRRKERRSWRRRDRSSEIRGRFGCELDAPYRAYG